MLLQFDRWLFLQLNSGAANPFFDWLMPLVTELRFWLLPILAGMLALVIFGGGKGRTVVLISLVLFTVTDQLSSHLLKPLIARERPCHVIEGVRLLYQCRHSFSFPSSHAVTAMAAAIFFGSVYGRWWWGLLLPAVVVSYSRVYLGIHYPSDLLGGWIIGGLIASLTVVLYRRYIQSWANQFSFLAARTGKERPPHDA